MAKGKNVLTTGDVAKICNVAPRTVSKWFDNGQLKGYRIPGSKDRRIPVNELIRFMKAHDMPVTALEMGTTRVLIVDSEDGAPGLAQTLQEKGGYEVQVVTNNFETGAFAHRFSPHVLLVNLLAEGIEAIEICRSIRSDEDLEAIRIVALASGLSDSEARALLQKGFDGCICNPGDVDKVIKKIEEVTAIIY